MHASYHNPLANSEAEVTLHIANGKPSYSIRVDSARVSAERRSPLYDGRVRAFSCIRSMT